MGFLHLAQAVFIIILSNDFTLPITTSFLTFNESMGKLWPVIDTLVNLPLDADATPENLGAAGLKKLELARAIATQPRLLLADESLGGDKSITYRYRVTVDVTDEGGETRSAERSYRLGFISVEASLSWESAFFLENQPVEISILRATLDGIPRSGKGTWKILSLEEPEETLLPAEQPLFVPEEFQEETGYRTPGDQQRERWNHGYNATNVLMQWESGATRASGSVSHNDKGEGNVSLSGLSSGAYRLVYETVDDFGEEYETSENFIVASDSMTLKLPAIFSSEKGSLKVGDTARFLVHSGLEDQFMVFEIYRNDECIERREMRSGADSSFVEIPITEEDRGGLGASLTLVRDNQLIRLVGSVYVPWDNKELKVDFSTFRDRLRPGEKEKWSVKVTGPEGKDTAVPAAELLAYMYDRSLDAFVPHSPPSPISLYPYRAQLIQAYTNLGQARSLQLNSRGFTRGPSAPVLERDQLLVYSGYGIGGVGRRRGIGAGVAGRIEEEFALQRDGITVNNKLNTMEVAGVAALEAPPPEPGLVMYDKSEAEKSVSPAIELRSNFSETAFWEPHLLTDENGSVSFEFEVPDSVTSWNVYAHAITADLESGSLKKEARTVKELMVRTPIRFIRMDEPIVQKFIEKYPYYVRVVIPKNTYNTDENVLTVGAGNLLIVNEAMSDELAYKITAALYDHVDEFQKVHPSTKNVNLESAPNAGITLHPGAERYYREKGALK